MRYFKTSLRPSVNYLSSFLLWNAQHKNKFKTHKKAQSYLSKLTHWVGASNIKWPKGGGGRGGMSVRRYNVSLTAPVKTHSVRCQSSAEGSMVSNLAKFLFTGEGEQKHESRRVVAGQKMAWKGSLRLHILKQLIFCHIREFSLGPGRRLSKSACCIHMRV